MKKFFRKVGVFIKRNAYALAVTTCVLLVLTMVSVTALTIANDKGNKVQNPDDIPSVPSDTTEVVVFTSPIAEGKVSKGYAEHHLLEDKTTGFWQTHQGIDYQASEGTKVLAVYDGEVEDVVNDMMDGLIITIKHDGGLKSVYKCLGDEALVSKGDKVKKGQEIGTVSSNLTEKKDGAHLHFELYENDKLIDPTPYFEDAGK